MAENMNRKTAEYYLAAAQNSTGPKSQRDALMAIATILMGIEQHLALLASPTKTSFTHVRHEPPLPPTEPGDVSYRAGENPT